MGVEGYRRRLLYLKLTLCASLLAGLALSPRLWITDRAFPTLPAIQGMPDLSNGLCIALACGMVLSALLAMIFPRPRAFLIAVPALGAVLVLFDMNRLQPWFYQYLLMFLALSLVSWDEDGESTPRSALGICALILAFLYVWSGAQKANVAFASDVFPWLMEPLSKSISESAAANLNGMAYVVPVFEVVVGIMLLVPWMRTCGLIGAAVMHSFLLILLGPLGHNYNSVVWPWNIAMLLMSCIVFYRNEDAILGPALRHHLGKAIAVLVVVMPLFSFFGRWDDYLSASLYSGRTQDAWIMISEKAATRLQTDLDDAEKSRLREAFDGFSLDVTKWSMVELNVPLYPERRVFDTLAQKLRKYGSDTGDVTLYVSERPSLVGESAGFQEASLR